MAANDSQWQCRGDDRVALRYQAQTKATCVERGFEYVDLEPEEPPATEAASAAALAALPAAGVMAILTAPCVFCIDYPE